jgi:hypothetical protein
MMVERQGFHTRPLYKFSLTGHIPADHLVRSIDRLNDLLDIKRNLALFHSTMGRPSTVSDGVDAPRRHRLCQGGGC